MKLKIQGVYDAGEKGERIILKAVEDVALSRYLITDTTYRDGVVSNKTPHAFRFPSCKVKKGEFVSLRTGRGDYEKVENEGNIFHRFYWGLNITVWNKDGDQAELYELADLHELKTA